MAQLLGLDGYLFGCLFGWLIWRGSRSPSTSTCCLIHLKHAVTPRVEIVSRRSLKLVLFAGGFLPDLSTTYSQHMQHSVTNLSALLYTSGSAFCGGIIKF
jgi:hypothetical protein